MDYTKSDHYGTHVVSGNRYHVANQAIPTAVSDADLNGVSWELLSLIKASGQTPKAFDPDNALSYQQVLKAVKFFAWGDVDASTSKYAPIESPVFTGTPKVPTPSAFDNTTRIVSTAYLENAISGEGSADVTAGGSITLTLDQCNSPHIFFFGTPTVQPTVIFPDEVNRLYVVTNNTTQSIYLKRPSQATPIALEAGRRRIVYITSVAVQDATKNLIVDPYEKILSTQVIPSVAIVTNASVVSATRAHFTRVGKSLVFSARFSITPSASGDYVLAFNTPYDTILDITDLYRSIGVAIDSKAGIGYVVVDTVNKRILVNMTNNTTTVSRAVYVSGTIGLTE